MTLNQIAYNIKNIVEGGIAGDDSNLSITQIKYMVNYHRAQLLTKYTDSGRFVSDAMLSVKSAVNSGGTMTIPTILGWANNRAIKEVTLTDSTTGKIHNLPVMAPSEVEFFLSTRFAPNESHFFSSYSIDDGLRVRNNDGTTYANNNHILTAKVVLTNPEESGWSSTDYPIPAELLGSLTEAVLAKEFNVFLRVTPDYANNAVDERAAKMAATPTKASPNANARSRKARTR